MCIILNLDLANLLFSVHLCLRLILLLYVIRLSRLLNPIDLFIVLHGLHGIIIRLMGSLILLTLLMPVLLLERLLPLEQHVVSQLYFLLAFIIVLQVCVLLALKSPQELEVLLS
jgi:hypothetical protein